MPNPSSRPKYAKSSSVDVSESKNEIEKNLLRYGATQFVYGWETDRAQVGFEIDGRQVRILLLLPPREEFATVNAGARGVVRRSEAETDSVWQQAVRSRWRALSFIVKAKLVAVEAGITTIEREFLSDLVLPTGQTVGEWLAPQLDDIYEKHEYPMLMAGLGEAKPLPPRRPK